MDWHVILYEVIVFKAKLLGQLTKSSLQWCMYSVLEKTNRAPIAIIDFPLHVKQMHENQDYPFSREFEV